MFVRWESQTVQNEASSRLPGYQDAVVRRFDAPEALDTRFHEVHTKSALNKVPEGVAPAVRWTVNPYRGCTHAASIASPGRRTSTWTSTRGGTSRREIIVKVNVPEVLRAELARPSWKGEHVALGTNTDPYQWVEGRYRLMRGIWEALRDAAQPVLDADEVAAAAARHGPVAGDRRA